MADTKITGFADGGAILDTDEFVIARSGANYKIAGAKLLYPVFDSILGADAASIDTGAGAIPAGGSDLLIELALQTSENGPIGVANITFNNDTGANYDRMYIRVRNATLSGLSFSAESNVGVIATAIGGGTPADSNVWSQVALDVFNYASAHYKHFVGRAAAICTPGTVANYYLDQYAGMWRSATAISRVAVTCATGGQNLKAGSRMTIYKLP